MERVLVVEDDPDIGLTLGMALEHAWRVEVCKDAHAALAAIDKERPAVILLDLMLPGMDGATFAKELDARGLRGVPIVVVSASHEIATRSQALGARAWIRKPFDLDELERTLRSVVGKAE